MFGIIAIVLNIKSSRLPSSFTFLSFHPSFSLVHLFLRFSILCCVWHRKYTLKTGWIINSSLTECSTCFWARNGTRSNKNFHCYYYCLIFWSFCFFWKLTKENKLYKWDKFDKHTIKFNREHSHSYSQLAEINACMHGPSFIHFHKNNEL